MPEANDHVVVTQRWPPFCNSNVNPIRIVSSKRKALVRDKDKCSIDAQWNTVREVSQILKPEECNSHFGSAG